MKSQVAGASQLMPNVGRRRFLQASTLALGTLAATRCSRAPEHADVIILGAGLAGLGAALALQDQGINVRILEARKRAGGRIVTLHDLPGKPEAGGTQLSSNYKRFVALAARFDIPLKADSPMRREQPEFWISLNGKPISAEQWGSHAENPFSGQQATLPPWALPFAAMSADNPLPDIGSWRDPAYSGHDISVAEHLGWTDEQLRIGFGVNPGYGQNAHEQSALMWFQIMKAIAAPGGKLLTVDGGNDRVPLAAADYLGDKIRYDAIVERIDTTAKGVDLWTIDGRRYHASHVLSTLPAASLRRVVVNAPLSAQQQAGIAELNYNRVVRAYFVPTHRFWEDDKLPPSIWSDSLAGRVFALRGNGGDEITAIQCFITGPAAEQLDSLSKPAAMQAIMAELEAIRPATKGALKPAALVSWGNDAFAGGAYACWAPGQITRFANDLQKPAGRLHFAGEHTAQYARGIEGALESAERASEELLRVL